MRFLFFLLPVVLLLSNCANRGVSADADPALGGYCPVCYFAANEAVKGSAEFRSECEGKSYYFNSEESRQTFQKDPEKYLPQYDGWCAYGVAVGRKIPVNPTVFSIVDDKLYLNKNRWVGKSFDKDVRGYITKADAKWGEL